MRHFRLALVPLALAAALAAPAAVADTKIGAINFNVLLREAPQVKAAEQKFKIEFDKRDQDLQGDKKKFQEDAKKYQREADTMSATQKAAAEKDLFSRRQDLDLKERALNEEATARNQELQRGFIEQIGKALDQVVKDKQLDLVVRDPAFVAPSMDITQDVLKALAALPDATPADDSSKKKKKK
jgi:outer membrane protein